MKADQTSFFDRPGMFRPPPRTDAEADLDAIVLDSMQPFGEPVTFGEIMARVNLDDQPRVVRQRINRPAMSAVEVHKSLMRLVARQAIRPGPPAAWGNATWYGVEPWAERGFAGGSDPA